MPTEDKAAKAKGREPRRGREDPERVVKRWDPEPAESEREVDDEELREAPSSTTRWEREAAAAPRRPSGELGSGRALSDLGRPESREVYWRPSGELEQALLEELRGPEAGGFEDSSEGGGAGAEELGTAQRGAAGEARAAASTSEAEKESE